MQSQTSSPSRRKTYVIIAFVMMAFTSFSQNSISIDTDVITGAERTIEYFQLLKGKNVGLVVNQTSMVGKTHIADTLISAGITVKKIFAPEHGFRGSADAGEHIVSEVDPKTGIPIISLYGKNYKPVPDQLRDIDVMIYDIQDVGVRFYTYISTLHYVMEACAENGVELLILDRPNPNGFYVDGPVLDTAFQSFVGIDPIPIVYGMTPAEYALMVNGEKWLKNDTACKLSYVLCANYDHKSLYSLPVPPSPNLRTMTAIYLYPSLCLFEGTRVSVGRGTPKPFMQIGFPGYQNGNIQFTPQATSGAKNPMYKDSLCNGIDLSILNYGFFVKNNRVSLHWLMKMYTGYPHKAKFFTPYFNLLAGNSELRKQIETGVPEMEIRRSWEPELTEFKKMRKKYLLYPDFEE